MAQCLLSPSVILKKSTESLTRYNYQHLLEIVGISSHPLSAYQIAKKMGDRGSKYVYEMIEKHLCPYYGLYLTLTPNIDNSKVINEERINLATMLNGVFELNFPLARKGALLIQKGLQFPYVDHRQLEFTRDLNNDTITVSF